MDRFEMLLEPLRVFLRQIGDLLPRLALAAVVLVAGWIVAKGVRFGVERGLRAVNFHVVTDRAGIDGFLRDAGMRLDSTGILGALFYWVVIVVALIIGFNLLGLSYITDLLMRVLLFAPNVFVALLVIAFGAYFARFVGNAVASYCRSIGAQDAELLGAVARTAIVVFVVLIALDQMAIGGEIVRQTFLIVLAGVVLAFAIAFGLGGKEWAAELLERWWPRNRKP